VKISGKSGRPLAVLAGAALLTASALAGGGRAGAVARGAGPLAGGGRAGAVARGAGHPVPRAAVLAFILHHGINLAGLSGHGLRASALPKGARSVPEPGNASELLGVACTSSANCWAVGTYSPPAGEIDLNEVLHWDGSTWAQVSVPSPAGSATGDASVLFGVRCLVASDCWAVGISESNGAATFDQALHWNGTKWSVVSTPTPGGSLTGDVNELLEVVCTASANCWAVGEFGTQTGAPLLVNQMLHWNGRKWALASVPNPAGSASNDLNRLDSIRCTSATNCLAVGTDGTLSSPLTLVNQALQWNGTTWSQVSIPSPGGTTGNGTFNELDGLGCSSPANCWAVGSDGTFPGTLFNQAMHWNGTAWSQVTTPQPNGTGTGAQQELLFVTCKSGTNCWAVGHYGSISGTPGFIQNQAMHWDGGTWTQVDTPELGGAASGDTNFLRAVRCTSTTNCWAVGLAQVNSVPPFGTALHWNGTTWSPG
jgi:hypothetical protein